MSAKQVNEALNDEAHVFMMLASMSAEIRAVINELSTICEFPEVFPNDISDFPPGREIKFTIDLVPGTNLISMDPY